MKRINSILSEDSCFGEKSRKPERAIQPIGIDINIVENVEEMTRFKVSCIKLKKHGSCNKAEEKRRTYDQANTRAIIYTDEDELGGRDSRHKDSITKPGGGSCGRRPSQQPHFPPHWHRSSADRHTTQGHHLGSIQGQHIYYPPNLPGQLTSIRQKLGVGSSPSGQKPELMAPVALPGLIKNRPSISNASKRWVPPHSKTSTSIWRAAISNASASAGGTMVWP